MPKPLRYEDPKLQDRLASNYVLGTLQGQARKRFEKLRDQDENLAKRVRQWEAKLQPVHEVTEAMAPKKDTWAKISGAINKTSNHLVEKLLKRLRIYKAVTGFAVTCALVMGVFSYTTVSTITHGNTINYVAVLKNNADEPAMVATLEKARRLLILDLLKKPKIGQDNDIQLWTISKEDGSFKSLGLVNVEKQVRLQLSKPEWGLIKDAEYLVVSVESKGGSTTGLPSERIISKGLCVMVKGWETKTG